uniref:Uncharacterized protein n=1 Tax=Octopus bimaculoides TaxID=37653 RepID=A0A0L8H1W6_OCTBM
MMKAKKNSSLQYFNEETVLASTKAELFNTLINRR